MRRSAPARRPRVERARAPPSDLVVVALLALLGSSLLAVSNPVAARSVPTMAGGLAPGAPYGRVVASIDVGKNPLAPVLDPANGEVYVANYDVSNVSVISGSSDALVATIPTGIQPVPPALDLPNGTLYLATEGTNSVSVISGASNTVAATVSVAAAPLPLSPVADPRTGDLYITSALSSDVVVLNASTDAIAATIALSAPPLPPAVDTANGEVFVPIEGTNDVSVIAGATNAVVANLTVGGAYLQTPAFDPANGDLYFPEISGVGSAAAGGIAVLSGSTDRIVANLSVGLLPETPVVDPVQGTILVANYGSDTLSVLNGTTNSVVATVGTGIGPDVPAFDDGNDGVYVANALSGNVTVISAARDAVVGTIPVGSGPEAATYDGAEHELFVANRASNNVSVIDDGTRPSENVTFSESWLPAGARWSVALDGVVKNSTGGKVVFEVPNGTYTFAIAGSEGCAAAGPKGVATVGPGDLAVPVRFVSGACEEWLGIGIRTWEGIAAGAAVALLAVGLGAWAVSFRRARRSEGPDEPARVDATASPPAAGAGPSARFRRERDRGRIRLIGAVVGVALLVLVAYLVVVPDLRPPPGSSVAPTGGSLVRLGPAALGVVPCSTGPAAIAERIPWINASVTVTTDDAILVVVDLDGDTLYSTGPLPSVSASSDCAGALPTPNWTASSGLNVGFSWYVVLSDPSGTNIAYYTLTQGWLPVGNGPWPAPIANGSALTLVCNPTVSHLGAYQFESTYTLEVGLILSGGSGTAIAGIADL